MRKVLLVLSVFSGAVLSGAGAVSAQDAVGTLFGDAFFAEERITESVRERPDVSSLERSEMNALLQARKALSDFFQALKPGASGDVLAFLAPELTGRYVDRTALRRERFGAEAYLSFEIIDFRISDDRSEIKLRYFLAENTQGKALIRQRAVTFRNGGAGWRIADFDNFAFD